MKKLILAITISAMAFGCSKSDSDGDGNGGGNQDAAVLASPANNTECITGTSISNTESKVTLTWSAANGAQSYFVYLKNLSTQATLQFSAGTATSYEATLAKGTPYSWYVSANKANSTVKSETFKFYNAGTGTTSHAPFPADLVAPLMSSTINGPTVTLQWAGADVDNDIKDYKIYLDTNSTPTTLAGTVTAQQLPGVGIITGSTYYWKIVTSDRAGNSTSSPVYQFKVY